MNKHIFALHWALSAGVLGLLCLFTLDSSAQSENIGNNVSLINLIATPERYDGKLVFVTGYVSIEMENMSVCLNKNAVSPKDCVWLIIDSGPYETKADMARFESKEKIWRQFHGKIVSMRGVFDKNETGHLGLWSGAIRNVVDVYSGDKHLSFGN